MRKNVTFHNGRFLLLSGLFIFVQHVLVNGQTTLHEIKQHIYNQIDIRNQNWSIYQSSKNGLVYFANSEGLIEYNGITPKLYRMPYDRGLRSVCVDDSGTIFTGTFEEFGYWKRRYDGTLAYHSLAKITNIRKNDDIWKIYTIQNKVYFQSFTTIYIYDYMKITEVKTPFIMLFLLQTRDRFIVQGIDNGLYWFDGLNFTYIDESKMFGSMKVHSIIEKQDGTILICTASQGIFLFNGVSFKPWKSEISEFLKNYTCNAAVYMSDSLFVFGSILNGVVFCDAKGQIQNHFNFSNGLKNNTVLALHANKQQGLWIGLDEGVNYLDFPSPAMYYTNTSGTLGTIYTVLKNKDELLLGTNHGLFSAKIFENKDNFNFTGIHIIPESQGQVWALNEFDGQILCGHNDGTYVYENNKLNVLSDITGGWSLKPLEDKLIVGTYTGLIVFEKNKQSRWKFRNRIQGYGDPTRHVEVDYLGYVWAAHAMKGIYKIELNKNQDSVVNYEYFSNIFPKQPNIDVFNVNNRILFTTTEKLYTYDYVANKIVPFLPLNDDLGDYCKSTQVIPFTKNAYWFVNKNKIGLFEIGIDFKARKIRELVLENPHISERDLQVISLNDHIILIPGRQGFTTYNMAFNNQSADSSKAFFLQLTFSGRKKTSSFGADTKELISVPYNSNNLTVSFADPSGFNQRNKTFYYRLPSIEDTWHATTLDNFTYLNLHFGRHKLQIRSEIDNRVAEISFHIKRPWYLSGIAFIGYFCILVLLVFLVLQIFKFELAKQRQLLEYKVNKTHLEKELSYTSQELMFTMRYLIQKNEILTELKQQIDLMKEDSARYPVKFVKSMENIIKEGLESQTIEWKNALSTLKLSEQGFFKKLLETYPNLTTNDLRLCSYLRMNFSSKEIAKLLNISSRGVEIGRYRLRKKMNLGHDVNLTEFLMSKEFEA
jgi:ligand-binding sensor domain-containing protein/DNA-binding CsgD family transcriptional regulator